MTQEVEKLTEQLSKNIEKVQNLHAKCQNENIQLKKRVDALLEELSRTNRLNEELNQRYESLKLAKVIAASSDESHDAKIKLNRIIREVDKCISLLNK